MNATTEPLAKPPIKWVGGKGRLLPQLMPLLPTDWPDRRHVELFMGGAAMFFATRPSAALLCDVNASLVSMYTCLRTDVAQVIAFLREYETAYRNGQPYEAFRDRYNREGYTFERAALFLFLNRTCFNGLYRVNRTGAFNVPEGRYAKTASICDEPTLRRAALALQRAPLMVGDFDDTAQFVSSSDFVYLDPPYDAIPTQKSNFAHYAPSGFNRNDQKRLHAVAVAMGDRGAAVMLSNADTEFIRELYDGWRVDVIQAPRSINRDGAARGAVSELVIRNY